MTRANSGLRIRQLRLAKGLKQTDLAHNVGISASYLNLIEHNRRSISDAILSALSSVLETPKETILGDADDSLTSDLATALAEQPKVQIDSPREEELIARFPGWAALIAAQARQIRDQASAISTLNERHNFDPRLQSTLHEMLTNITAIRSTASILAKGEDLPRAQNSRFQSNVYDESVRLSDAVSGLVSYFDNKNAMAETAATSQEEFELFLESYDYVFSVLEDAKDFGSLIEDVIENDQVLVSPDAIARAQQHLQTFAKDAAKLPLQEFGKAAASVNYAPAEIAEIFGCDLHTVFRRLAVLRRNGLEAPRFGLVIVNAAGHPLFRRPLKELSVPRFVSICALWPVFSALSTPGLASEDTMELPDGRQFLSRSYAAPLNQTQFGERPVMASGMLVTTMEDASAFGMLNDHRPAPIIATGTTCKLCPRLACSARSDPSMVVTQNS